MDAILSPNRVGLIRAALATHLLGYTATALHALNADDDALMAEFERFERYRTVWAERGVGVLLRSLLVDFAITERLLTSALGERRLTNLRQLIELLQTAAADHPAPDALRHWLQTEQGEETADEVSQLRLESDRDLVQIVSIHAAKGLEFPHVFLLGAEDGLIPHERSKSEGTVDEERRLFYVGITRAMKSLTITHCLHRTKFGSAIYCLPSPFLKEIEGEGVLVESYEEIVNRPVAAEDISASFASMREMLARD